MDCSMARAVYPDPWGQAPWILLDLAHDGVCLCLSLCRESGDLLPRHCTLAMPQKAAGGMISVALSSPCGLLLLGAIMPA